jgi:transcriptional regulator with XRE-family HTH domain
MSLGGKLREQRIKEGLSLQDLADRVGASKAHIWELETGRAKNPTIELLTKLAKALSVSVADLIDENPAGETDPRLVGMYRDLKQLKPSDQEAIQRMVDHLKNRDTES